MRGRANVVQTIARLTEDQQELPYWLVLNRYAGIGPKHFQHLVQAFGKLSNLFNNQAPVLDLQHFLKKVGAKNLQPNWAAVEQDLAFLDKPHAHIICFNQVNYPILLKQISNPPPLLFVEGDAEVLAHAQLAMVGSRNPTPMGAEMAFQFARYLVSKRLVITSGLAIGVDGASHRGALAGQGKTIAVIGSGVDKIYPSVHIQLAKQIIEQGGALVSEFPMGTLPRKEFFPRRNRLISGLSMGVLVVEAALNSGSLITAKCAVDQGREVFAIPGSPHNTLARGCHQLIKEGAKLVEEAEDILQELLPLSKYVHFNLNNINNMNTKESDNEVSLKTKMNTEGALPLTQNKTLNFTGDNNPQEKQVLAQIGFECTSVDTIIERSGLTAEEVSSMLLALELTDKILSVPGGYVRNHINGD
jgi:DNA processing protein